MIDLDFIEQLKSLDLLVKRKVISSYAGEQRSIRQGRGIEPVDFREYFPGDDLKFVDWKIYARTERLFIKRFEEEKDLTTHILLDASKSMDFGSGRYTKFDFGSMLAIGFAYLVTKENEKFILATYNDDLVENTGVKRGKAHFFNAVDLVNRQKLERKTNLERAVTRYEKFIRSRSLLILISDFLEPIEGIESGIARLARKSKNMIVIHVMDPVETGEKWEGDTKLYDLETNEVKRVFFSPDLRREYAVRMMAHIEKVRGICNSVGADFFSAKTNSPVFDIFFGITHLNPRGHKK